MKRLIRIPLLLFSIVALNTAYAQVDTARQFIPKENGVADKKLKKEIQQKQLQEKPVLLNTDQNTVASDKQFPKKKPLKKVYRKKRKTTSK